MINEGDKVGVMHCESLLEYPKRAINDALNEAFENLKEQARAFDLSRLALRYQSNIVKMSKFCPQCKRQVVITARWIKEKFLEICDLLRA